MSIALHLETKHCIPFVLHLPRYFWLKAALFALCQDSGAKTTLSQCEVHRSRTGPDLPEGTRQSLSMQIALHHSISHEFYRRFTLPIADVSQNPPFLSVKSFLDSVCRAKPRAGCKCTWERLLWNRITSCTFTSKYCGTFMNVPWHMFPIPASRHVTLWQKMLVIFPVAFPLTVLTTSEEYSGSLEAAMSENHPTSSSVNSRMIY